MLTYTSDQWIIIALIFILGMLIGAFLTAGGRRKWKTRYGEERRRADELEKRHKEREAHWAEREKDWRERDSLRGAAVKDTRDPEDRRPL